jgi:hypothetical protein
MKRVVISDLAYGHSIWPCAFNATKTPAAPPTYNLHVGEVGKAPRDAFNTSKRIGLKTPFALTEVEHAQNDE